MSKEKHTPTPWIAEDFPKEILIRAEDGSFIMTIRKSLYPSEKIANANLIVRAVNNHDRLVEALENAKEVLQGMLDGNVCSHAGDDIIKQLLTELKS